MTLSTSDAQLIGGNPSSTLDDDDVAAAPTSVVRVTASVASTLVNGGCAMTDLSSGVSRDAHARQPHGYIRIVCAMRAQGCARAADHVTRSKQQRRHRMPKQQQQRLWVSSGAGCSLALCAPAQYARPGKRQK